jgi:hypothetical protein
MPWVTPWPCSTLSGFRAFIHQEDNRRRQRHGVARSVAGGQAGQLEGAADRIDLTFVNQANSDVFYGEGWRCAWRFGT